MSEDVAMVICFIIMAYGAYYLTGWVIDRLVAMYGKRKKEI